MDFVGSLQDISVNAQLHEGPVIFPDTSVFIEQNNAIMRPYSQAAGLTFTTEYHYGWVDEFYVDSISVDYFYHRNSLISVVDTLIITVIPYDQKDFSVFPINNKYVSTGNNDYVVPNFRLNKVTTSEQATTIKYPLSNINETMDDTPNTIDAKIQQVITTDNQSIASLFGIVVSFKPGYAYNAGDTITSTGNYISLATLDENTSNNLPELYYTSHVSSVLTSNIELLAHQHDTAFVPLFYLDSGKVWEHYAIRSSIQACAVGGEDLFLENEISVYPIPTSSKLNIESSIKRKVALVIIDQNGRVVLKDEFTLKNNKTIDLKNVQKGNYTIVLRSGKLGMTKTISVLN